MTTAPDPDAARELFRQGLRHDEAGAVDEAARSFEASLALDAQRASTRVHLAAARLKQGRADETLALLDEVLAAQPQHVDALGLRGTALATQGRFEDALQAFDGALAVRPQLAQARALRARVLQELGRGEEPEAAMPADDGPTLQFRAAAQSESPPPPIAPRAYVQQLFDDYAASFDAELLDTLDYRVPRQLGEGVVALGRRFAAALDLGCGTGLCGPWMRALSDRLEGVDLSPAMLQQAGQRGGYDALHAADIVEFLSATPSRFDLVVAADVFVYIGALQAVFEQAASRMAAGGVFCFTVEEHPGAEPFVLRPTRRYAHSSGHVLALAERWGFDVLQTLRAPLRDHGAETIAGFYVWLARRADAP
jgi:predicted TPR repeat methyltransferase